MKKLDRLEALGEDELRQQVVVPLLSRMGFRSPIIYHGSLERGKDVIAFDVDRLGRRWHLGVVAKCVDLTGDMSSNRSLREAVFQAEQCFKVPYHDLYGMRTVMMDQVWIVTTGRVIPGAADAVIDHLRNANLHTVVRIVDGEKLQGLVDQYYPAYWDDTESVDALREQRDRAQEVLRRVLSSAGADETQIKTVAQYLRNGRHLPEVRVDQGRMLTSASSYMIEFDTVDMPYGYLQGREGGLLREQYRIARDLLGRAMLDVEDLIFRYESIVGITDPEEFAKRFEKELAGEYPFRREAYGVGADATNAISLLAQEIRECRHFGEHLRTCGRLDEAEGWFKSIDAAESDVLPLLEGDREALEIYWLPVDGDSHELRPELADGSGSEASVLVSKHRVTRDVWDRSSGGHVQRPVSPREVIDEALWQLRMRLEETTGYDPEW